MTDTGVPDGYHTVTPYLVVKDVAAYIEFLGRAFDARVTERIVLPDGSVGHAEVRIGDSQVMLGGAWGEWSPRETMLYLYLADADAAHAQALAAGATNFQEPRDEVYGDRVGAVTCPAGNSWWLATRVREVAAEEIAAEMARRREG